MSVRNELRINITDNLINFRDTTVLSEILEQCSDALIYESLSDDLQSRVYFQPQLSDDEWYLNRRDFSTSSVYHRLENAKKDFPTQKIDMMIDDEIENPIFIDGEMNKKTEIEIILIGFLRMIGIDKPINFEIILQFIYEDIQETADINNWSDSDVAIGFRRWIEIKK